MDIRCFLLTRNAAYRISFQCAFSHFAWVLRLDASVCLSVCPHSNRKKSWAINTKTWYT